MKQNQENILKLETGRVPPQAVDIEMAVLGAMLLDRNAIDTVMEMLDVASFYKPQHQDIFEAVKALSDRNDPVDHITLRTELDKRGKLEKVGGDLYLTELTGKVTSGANVEYHARVVFEKALARKIIVTGANLVDRAYSPTEDILGLLEAAETEILSIAEFRIQEQALSVSQSLGKAVDYLEKIHGHKTGVIGVPAGFPALDSMTGGFHKTELIIIAGRPSQGKTALVLAITKNAATLNIPVGFFSLEMSTEELLTRLIASEACVNGHSLRTGRAEEEEWLRINAVLPALAKLPIFIDETANQSIADIKAKSRRLKHEQNIGLIVVDYLQLMRGTGKEQSREQEIAAISRGLKGLAKELNIPVIALSQLNRSVENRADKRPMLSDLRECLSLETSLMDCSGGIQSACDSPMNVLSLNRQGKIIAGMSEHITKRSNTVYRLNLKSGRFVDCTAKHQILTSDGFKELRKIGTQDSIACALNGPVEGRNIPEARFIGWMIGNGSMVGYASPSFITPDKVIADAFCDFVEKRFGRQPHRHKHWSDIYQYDITFGPTRTAAGNPAKDWLKEHDLWGRRSWEKYIPQWFTQEANKESLANLLGGLWETDGSVVMGKRQLLSYSSTSELLARQILSILARFGIAALVDKGFYAKKAKHACYKITIANPDDIELFRINVHLGGKKGQSLARIDTAKRIPSNFLNKLGSETTKVIQTALAELGIPKSLARVQTHGGRRLRKASLFEIIKSVPAITEKFGWLLSEDIFWDPVKSIETIGERAVFDRHVPHNYNFVVNGIIVHNSGALEQDSSTVIFVHRPEMYGTKEVDGQDTANMMETIVAKQRNGPVGSPKLKFLKESTRFEPWQYSAAASKEAKDDLPF